MQEHPPFASDQSIQLVSQQAMLPMLNSLEYIFTDSDKVRMERKLRIVAILVFLSLVWMLSLPFTSDLIEKLYKGDWNEKIALLRIIAITIGIASISFSVAKRNLSNFAKTLQLRMRMCFDESTIAPVDGNQPQTLYDNEIPLKSQKLRFYRNQKYFLILVLGLMFLALVLFLGIVLASAYWYGSLQSLTILTVIGILGVSIYVFVMGMAMTMAGWHGLLRSTVTADYNGIYWRKTHFFWPKRYTLLWQDVQGFFVVRFESNSKLVKEKAFLTYIINSDHATLVWTINATSHGTTRAATDMLSRLVVTYTRQPLRDLTEAATDILLASNT